MSTQKVVIAALLAVAVACSREQAHQTKETVKAKVKDVFEVAVPVGKDDPAAREKERLDEQWRKLRSFTPAPQPAPVPPPQAAPAPEQPLVIQARTKQTKETFKNVGGPDINAAPVMLPISGDLRGPSILKTQVLLDRLHFSVGAIDGQWGRNSAITLWWWQRANGLNATGEVDEATYRALARAAGYPETVTQYTITADDVKGPFTSIPDDPYEKAELKCLCYESLQELLAERFHSAQEMLEVLNAGQEFSGMQAGTTIWVPNVRPALTTDQPDIAKIVISLRGNSYNGFDAAGNMTFHAPTTIGSTYDPSPNDTLKVIDVIHDPHFHYDPTLYAEVSDSKPDAHMNPGPNSPVGVVWMALSREHYGMHGTNDPEAIGYTSSHGCVRLTNWDAAEVSRRITKGVPVAFVDTKRDE